MKKISDSLSETKISLQGGIFFAISSGNRWSGIHFSQEELAKDWWAQLPTTSFECKVIGPTALESMVRKKLQDLGRSCLKYVPREAGEVIFEPSTGRLRVEKAASTIVPANSAPEKIAHTSVKSSGKIKIAIVDDSKTIRNLLRKIFSADSGLEVIADFENPREALAKIPELKPDVITLDIHMPEMDGVQFLKNLMPKHSIPTIMISSISMEEGPMVLNALEAGAVDYIQKPSFEQIAAVSPIIIEKVKIAALAKVHKRGASAATKSSFIPQDFAVDRNKIIAIGSSTGGTEALREVLTRLPAKIPPIIIVQHIPAVFSKSFADRMHSLCKFAVTEAVDGDIVEPDHCYIAPGGFQMRLERSRADQWILRVEDAPPVNRHKPSVDYLFDSVAQLVGRKAVGAILTGMGADGAKGLLRMRQAGAPTFGQNEESCVVYGMPQVAMKMGAVEKELNLFDIPDALMRAVAAKKIAA